MLSLAVLAECSTGRFPRSGSPPYPFGERDTSRLAALLRDRPDIEIRIRRMP
jgi:hypothetical protein